MEDTTALASSDDRPSDESNCLNAALTGAGVTVGNSSIPGGGDCLLAKKSFGAGQTIFSEKAAAKLQAEAFNCEDSAMLAEAYANLAVSGQEEVLLNSTAGKALFRGANGNSRIRAYQLWAEEVWPDGTEQSHSKAAEVLTLFAYNAFISEPGGQYHVVFPNVSKANHSCAANALMLAPDDGVGELICTRPIKAGEEVSISYLADVDLLLPTKQRQRMLEEKWDFICCCSRCRSDEALEDVRSFGCHREGCGGCCSSQSGQEHLAVLPCNICGKHPWDDVVADWAVQEEKVSELMQQLPEALYSAWSVCEDFSQLHPTHGLTGRWKAHLARHLRRMANQEEDADEAKDLRNEAAMHHDQFLSCLNGLGICREESMLATDDVAPQPT